MRRILFYIEEYDWEVEVYDDFTCKNVSVVMRELERMDSSRIVREEAFDNMSACSLNTGFTYTSTERRKSLVVIYKTSSDGELVNTIVHEMIHIGQHIATYYGINLNSEEFCRLCGTIAEKMYESKFLI